MKASEFDKKFDANESVADALDLNGARRLGEEQKCINEDFLVWMIRALDRKARIMGVTR